MSSLRLPWPWSPGQHLAVIGETGSGKSTLVSKVLLPTRTYFVVMRTKMDDVRFPVQIVTKHARTIADQRYDRIELRPEPKRSTQAAELQKAYELVYKQGGWTVYNDERFYIEDILRIKEPLNMLTTQGRGKKLTMVDGAQRPTGISRFVLSQATHVVCFGIEPEDARTLASRTSGALAELCLDLRHHEFAWWNRITRRTWIGRLDSSLHNLVGQEVSVEDTRRRRYRVVGGTA